MKKILKWAICIMAVAMTGCSDDVTITDNNVPGNYSDGDVVFNMASRGQQTRTMYQDDWDATTNQQIYWGNYISTDPEQIKIYCAADTQTGYSYTVVPNSGTENLNIAAAINPVTTGQTLKWVGKDVTHKFYAFYPASLAGDQLLNGSESVISAAVTTGQSPKQYKRKVGQNGSLEVTDLKTIADNKTAGTQNSTVIYGEPDMENAVMVAKNIVGPDGFGEPVSLDFEVVADVLDLTINGPVRPNTLKSNANKEAADFINIQGVVIKYIGKDNKNICGKFDIDLDTKTVSNIVEGQNQIQLTTAQDGRFVTLHVRQTDDNLNAPAYTDIDHLRLRAFLIPGQVTDLSQLQVVVQTNCGDYTQDLSKTEMVSGKIHPINLSYFRKRGIEFDFSKWIGQLDPNIYLSELSIPGSWHSSNTNNQGNVTLKDQYQAGIRAFEVHTTNGTIPKKYGDITQDFDAKTAEYGTEHLNAKTTPNDPTAQNVGSFVAGSMDEPNPETDGKVVSSSGNFITGRTRIVELTQTQNLTIQCNVSQTGTTSYQQKPKFSLRLYRTRNVTSSDQNPDNSLSDALIALHNVMNKDGLIFLEIGHENPDGVDRQVYVNCRTVSANISRSTTITRHGTRTRTKRRTEKTDPFSNNWEVVQGEDYPANWSEWSDPTWDQVAASVLNDVNWTETGQPSESFDETMTIDTNEAWANAVETCINRMGSDIVYSNPVTANTTISDVQGRVIVKINTNDYGNENFWQPHTNALFSRWVDGSGSSPLTVNLQWGKPVAPQASGDPTTPIRWCYTELEKVSDIAARKKAIDNFAAKSYENYKIGDHNTFYECAIGGFYNANGYGNNAAGCQYLAQQLNPALLTALTDPSRQACPFGLVLMNYVIAPNDDQDTYRSKELIRTIINNNAAFYLNRRGASRQNVGDNTDANFQNNPNNPLKD